MDDALIKTQCPTQDTLQQLLDGTLTDVQDIESHLLSCKICQHQLDQLSQSDVLSPFLGDESLSGDIGQLHFLEPALRDDDVGSINGLFIEREVGRGGSGIVFRGFDPKLGRPIAVKVLHNDSSFRSESRFERESKIAASIRSDYVVSVYATGRTIDNRPYILMPLIQGLSLKQSLNQAMPKPRHSAEIVKQISLGLQALHDAGIVHRDVKPANILMDDTDARAKLTDFGLARKTVQGETLTQADVICGTPEYMSPEQAAGKQTVPQSDIYSLGITLYECLTGTTPFRGQSLNILRQHCHADPIGPGQINPNVPRDLETICMKCIAKEPSKRYRSARAMAEDLTRFLDSKPIVARPTGRAEKMVLWSLRNPGIAALSAATASLLLALAVGASVAAWNLNRANSRIITEKNKAKEAEARAVQDRAAAVTSLNKLVDSLYDDLSDNSATIKAREKLVAAAIEGLQSVTRIDGDAAGDRTQFLALMRMAELAALQGNKADSQEHYGKAIELASSQIEQLPNDPKWRLDLAMATSELGVVVRDSDAKHSATLNSQCQDMLTKLLDEDPNNNFARTLLVIEKGHQLELIRNQNFANPKAVIDFGTRILPELTEILEIADDGSRDNQNSIYQAAYSINFLLGRAHLESANSPLAMRYFRDAKAHIQNALAVKPNNVYLKSADGSLERAISMTAGSLGEMGLSLAAFDRSVDRFESLSVTNPDNVRMKHQLAGTLSIGSQTLLFSGEDQRALAATDRADRIYQQLTEAEPENPFYKILIGENWNRRLYVLLGLGMNDEAYELANRLRGYLNSIEGPSVAPAVSQQMIAVKSYEQVTGWLVNKPPENPTLDGKINAILFSFRPVVMLKQDFDLSGTSLLETVSRIQPDFSGTTIPDVFTLLRQMAGDSDQLSTQIFAVELGTYGLIGRNCSQSKDALLQARSQKCVDHCIEILQNNPINATGVMGLCDLDWLRGTEEFKSILPDLKAVWFGVN